MLLDRDSLAEEAGAELVAGGLCGAPDRAEQECVAVEVAQLPLTVNKRRSPPARPVQGGFRDRQSILMTLADHVEVHELLFDAGGQLGTADARPVLGRARQRRLGLVEGHPPQEHSRQPGERPAHRPARHAFTSQHRYGLTGQQLSFAPAAKAANAPREGHLGEAHSPGVEWAPLLRRLEPRAAERLGFAVASQLPKSLDQLVSPGCRRLRVPAMATVAQRDQLLQDGDGLVQPPAPKQHLVELLPHLGRHESRTALPRHLPRVSQRSLCTLGIERDDVTPALPEQFFSTPSRLQARRQPDEGHGRSFSRSTSLDLRRFGLDKTRHLV